MMKTSRIPVFPHLPALCVYSIPGLCHPPPRLDPVDVRAYLPILFEPVSLILCVQESLLRLANLGGSLLLRVLLMGRDGLSLCALGILAPKVALHRRREDLRGGWGGGGGLYVSRLAQSRSRLQRRRCSSTSTRGKRATLQAHSIWRGCSIARCSQSNYHRVKSESLQIQSLESKNAAVVYSK